MKINGTPQSKKHKALGAKKIKPPANNGGGKKGGPGCLPSLFVLAVLGTGWLSMVWQGWTA